GWIANAKSGRDLFSFACWRERVGRAAPFRREEGCSRVFLRDGTMALGMLTALCLRSKPPHLRMALPGGPEHSSPRSWPIPHGTALEKVDSCCLNVRDRRESQFASVRHRWGRGLS